MRLNQFIARASGLSRRAVDAAIEAGRVSVGGAPAVLGQTVSAADHVALDGRSITPAVKPTTIILNKPVGYVVSRSGQGAKTIYDLLPKHYHRLKPVGRLDKDSSGLLILTDDGQLAQELTHPSRQKIKIYEVKLNQPLQPLHRQIIAEKGINLDDGRSQLGLERLHDGDDRSWRVTMHEGRNRQIRRTFAALGYSVTNLHRTHFGPYRLSGLSSGKSRPLL